MILDCYRDGVTIFTDSNVTSIKGTNIKDICNEIYKRVVVARVTPLEELKYDQIYELYVDVSGIGVAYKDVLINMGLKIGDIRYREIDRILPVRLDDLPFFENRHAERLSDIRPVFI